MKIFYIIITIIWSSIILALSTMPGKDLPYYNLWDIIGTDKIGHFIFYGILAYLYAINFSISRYNRKKLRIIFLAFICTTTFGLIIETIQGTFFETRKADIFDAIANSIGAILGVLCFKYLAINYQKKYELIKRVYKKTI